MMQFRLVCVALTALLLLGCASRQRLEWAGGTGDVNQAMAQCDYEVAMATQQKDRSWGAAAGIEQNLRREDLAQRCMRAKGGWQLRVAAVASPPQAAQRYSITRVGPPDAHLATAETAAQAQGCSLPSARPLGIRGGQDTFEVACVGAPATVVVCSAGTCSTIN